MYQTSDCILPTFLAEMESFFSLFFTGVFSCLIFLNLPACRISNLKEGTCEISKGKRKWQLQVNNMSNTAHKLKYQCICSSHPSNYVTLSRAVNLVYMYGNVIEKCKFVAVVLSL